MTINIRYGTVRGDSIYRHVLLIKHNKKLPSRDKGVLVIDDVCLFTIRLLDITIDYVQTYFQQLSILY